MNHGSEIFRNKFSVSLEDSAAFARLSGDFNPLHVDPVAARRLRFGGTVAHGTHLFLRALNELAARNLLDLRQPSMLSATFENPVQTGTVVNLRADLDADKIRVSGDTPEQSAFNGVIELMASSGNEPWPEDAEFSPASPLDLEFRSQAEGTVPLKLNTKLLRVLFPALANVHGRSWIADLLATTQIVGMQCPGLHSVYSGFRLRRAAQLPRATTRMRYQISGAERRFHLLRIEVAGSYLSGKIETFFRPRPVQQLSMSAVAAAVSPNAFSGHRTLVVGGSRGLGELTAKIAAAGGADVTITYARGKEDAELVCADVRARGGMCTARYLDVAVNEAKTTPDWLAGTRFSHVYFFASPPIAKNPGRWNQALFEQFTRIYVAAFAILVEQMLSAPIAEDGSVHFMYPSSVFVTQPEVGFAEYAAAKAAGEALCDQLRHRRHARFTKPRLPRMRTDQTSALVDLGTLDPFPIMLDVVRSLHS